MPVSHKTEISIRPYGELERVLSMMPGLPTNPEREPTFDQGAWVAGVVDAKSGPEEGGAALDALTAEAQARFGASVAGVLFYGSVIRDRLRAADALFDMMVVVDDYRSAYGAWIPAVANWLLAPNVYYVEAMSQGTKVRAKYAVISLKQLAQLTSTRSFQSYFWGRLCQPLVLHWTRDSQSLNALSASLWQAVETFAIKTSPLMPSEFTSEEFWARGLKESYRTEFRPEKKQSRAEAISASGRERNARHCEELASKLGWKPADGGWKSSTPRPLRWFSRFTWLLRRVQGRVLHILRLAKAAFTFDGGIEYLSWKIERHSGAKVELSERAKKHPLLFGWWTLWKLKRKGGFR